MKSGATLIAGERRRQIAAEGFDKEHDVEHAEHALSAAAVAYLLFDICGSKELDDARFANLLEFVGENIWPWGTADWKPKDPERNLVRAGALIAAAIDKYHEETQ